MTVLFIIAHGGSGRHLRGLAGACRRRGVEFGIFFTGDGVRALSDSEVVACAHGAADSVVCEHSWSQAMERRPCPLTLGSQTDHSRMLGSADRVVSL